MDWTTTTWTTASYVFLHWRCVSERFHACILPDQFIGVSFEWDIFLFVLLRCVNALKPKLQAHKIITFIVFVDPKHNTIMLAGAVYASYTNGVSFE